MPPFAIPLGAHLLEPQPHLKIRQNDIVLTLIRASTTYTTTIGLSPSTEPVANPTSPPSNTQAVLPPPPSSDTPTGVVVGAVLGSILGTLVLLTLLYKCCIDNRSAAYIGNPYTSYDTDSSSGQSSVSSRVHNRGGGWDRRHHHHGVTRPRRTRTRRYRDMSERSGSVGRSEMGWTTRERRRKNMVKRNGMVGWRLVPRSRVYDGYERRWPRDRRDDKSQTLRDD